jgi:choice-of-anchor C domain-containing protein
MKTALLWFGLVSVASPALAQTNLVVNGDFAAGPQVSAQNGYATVDRGQSSLTGWTVSGQSVDYVTSSWVPPAGLVASIDLDGTPPNYPEGNQAQGMISQTIPTVVGAEYTAQFLLSGNPTCGKPLKKTLAIIGRHMHVYDYNSAVEQNSPTNMKWMPRTFSFTAYSDQTTLVFASETPGVCGPAVAGISVALSQSQP